MNSKELKEWLQGETSQSSGWTKENDEGGETIGHERFILLLPFSFSLLEQQ
jgi:hypothetical protein